MIYADMHAHPFLSPFQQREKEDEQMSTNPNDDTSVWHYNESSNRILNMLGYKFGFTTYSESDFTRCALHAVRLINVSIYPPERGFFELDTKTFIEKALHWFDLDRGVEVELGHLISGFSKTNIKHIKSDSYNYLDELKKQIDFVKNATSYSPDPKGCVGSLYSNIKKAKYVLLEDGDVKPYFTEQIIQVVLSVEGGNALWGLFTDKNKNLWNGSNFNKYISYDELNSYQALAENDFRNQITKTIVENEPDILKQLWPKEICEKLLANVRSFLKNYKVFSYTFAHHFYNGLCGHCASLQPLTDHNLVDQSFGIGTDITHLGYQVLNELLKNKIIIDVKHMSWKARQSFYCYHANHYPEIPIIASHAAVSGVSEWINETTHNDSIHPNPFYKQEINLCDLDIHKIVKSKGMIGVSFDQRVNGVQQTSMETFWRQFTYIAEVAAKIDQNPNETAWDNICIGTDFDGVIHPLDEYKTYDCLDSFYDCLLKRITEYMQNPPACFQDQDKLPAKGIAIKICYNNMSGFIKQYWH